MLKELQDLYLLARTTHQTAYTLMVAAEQQIKSARSKEELADAVYALKAIVDLFDDSRKESQRRVELAEKMCCMIWASDIMADGAPIRTPYCTASPEMKETPKTPKAGTPEYAEFCAHFGIDASTPFRPHWPSVLEASMQRLRDGLPPIPGCDPNDVWTVFRVTTRKKKGVAPDGVAYDEPSLDALKRSYEREQKLAAALATITDLTALCAEAKQDADATQGDDGASPF